MKVLLAITISASIDIEEGATSALVRGKFPRMISQAYTVKEDGTGASEQEQADAVNIAELNVFKWLYEEAVKKTEELGSIAETGFIPVTGGDA